MKEVDIVDAHDNIVGKAERSKAHKEGLLHRMVFVMVFNPAGELFMQQRAPNCDMYPGHWEGSLSGHVSSGEIVKDSALRELRGELHINTTPKYLEELVRFGLKEEEHVLATLFVMRDCKDKIELVGDEVSSGEFWTIDKVESELKGDKKFHPLFKKAFELFKDMKEPTKDFV